MPRDPAKNPLDDRIRAQHMLEAARDVAALAAGHCMDDLRTDMPMRRAMVNAIQEIGEAAAKVSPLGRARIPAIPWGVVVGMRNRLVHGYDEINIEVVWKVATEEIHLLIAALEAAFASWPLPEPPRP
ncbi:MAG: DUF86 domain-containing protein [Phycisphaerae bacterium]|nr:DUF86 domain-containing protein [Phycisphaerae bacterium]